MQQYVINVAQIEEWQTIKNTDELDRIFTRAQSVLVGGGTVVLMRQNRNGNKEKFDEITTLDDLAGYKKQVYKYLN